MRNSIYAKMLADSRTLLHDNIVIFIQECQIFYKYFLSMNGFYQHLQLPFLLLRQSLLSLFHIAKALVLFLPGLFFRPLESLSYLSAGIFLEVLSFYLSVVNVAVALFSFPFRLGHSLLRLTTIVDMERIEDTSIEDILHARLKF